MIDSPIYIPNYMSSSIIPPRINKMTILHYKNFSWEYPMFSTRASNSRSYYFLRSGEMVGLDSNLFFLISGDGLRGHVTPFFGKISERICNFHCKNGNFLQWRCNSHKILKPTVFRAKFTNFMVKFITISLPYFFWDLETWITVTKWSLKVLV